MIRIDDETPEERDARRKGIIAKVDRILNDMDASATMLGYDDEQHCYADAIIGIQEDPVGVVYDAEKVILALMEMNDWSYSNAVEWFDYNTVRGAPYYDNPPVFAGWHDEEEE